jgi:uncharacterized protein (TIGR03066 family)
MRVSRLAVVALALLAVPACSFNRGKLVGKWEYAGGGEDLPPDTRMVLEFTADGKFTWAVSSGIANKTITGKYRLGFANYVTLTDLSEPLKDSRTHTETVSVNGDELTMKDNGGKNSALKFRRVP